MRTSRSILVALAAATLLPVNATSSASAQTPPGRLGRWLGDTTAVPAGLGVNVHFTSGHIQDLRQIHNLGFRIVRTDLLWADVEREQGVYDWRQYDQLLDDMRAVGLRPMLVLAYSNPLYAPRTGAEAPSRSFAAPESGQARSGFMRFARAAAERFGAGVIWEVWNEPDLNFGTPVNLKAYASFAVEACQQIHQAVPDAPVIGPAASGFAWRLFRRLLAADVSGCFDAISVHPYRDRAPDDVLEDWAALTNMTCAERPACPALVSSEWGYSAWGGKWTAERQADYVPRIYLLNMIAGVPISVIYDWKDDGPRPDDKEANFGLLAYSGEPKPGHYTLQAVLEALDGLSPIGRVVSAGSRSMVLAFGKNGRPSKLVGWSESGGRTVVVPERACVSANVGRMEIKMLLDVCPAGAVAVPAAVPMRLTSTPSVADIPFPTPREDEVR